jgi:hypothetical protein
VVHDEIAARIRQRRVQMLLHSYLYYWLDAPIIDDATWQRWADELATLQMFHDGAIGFYDAAFADWDGSTGMHLPRDEWVHNNALKLQRYDDARRAALNDEFFA